MRHEPAVRHENELPSWLWLWLVLLLLAAQFGTKALVSDDAIYTAIFETEFGVVELLTAILLLPAAALALMSARLFWRAGQAIEAILLVGFALACLFLCGEEVSWGQHVFQWSSPDYFVDNNIQGETNLHNMEYFNKKVLKLVVIIGIAVGGLVVPILARIQPGLFGPGANRIARFMPTHVVVPTAIIVLVSHIGVKVLLNRYGIDTARDVIGISVREMTELYISIFFFLYALSLYRRVARPLGESTDVDAQETAQGSGMTTSLGSQS